MGKLALNINKKVFAGAKEKLGSGFDEDVELEPGRYNGTVTKIDIVQDGDQVVFRIQVPEANDGKGGRVSVWYNMTEPERAVWLLRTLEKFGYDVAEMDQDDVAKVLEEIESKKPTVRIRARRGGDYINVSIDKVIEGDGEGEDAETTTKSKPKAEEKEEEAEEEVEEKPTKKPAKDEKPTKKPAKEDDEEVVDEEEPKAEEKEVDLKPGLKLFATIQGEKQKVEIVEVHEDEQKVTVKTKEGKKFKVTLQKLSLD